MRAMKTIKKSAIIKEEEERLFSEMNILKNLDHPNILKLYELFQDDEHYFLITEFFIHFSFNNNSILDIVQEESCLTKSKA